MKKLTLEGEITFKVIVILKTVFQSFITTVPKHTVNKLKKI